MRIALLALCACALATGALAAPVRVELSRVGDGWQLLRGGEPYLVRGAGGDGSRELLASMGANSFRTWSADGLDESLALAHEHGLTVCVGIWLGQLRHGFRYDDAESVAAQYDSVRATVERYRDDPAVLLWALGNEAEGGGSSAAYWSALNSIAAMVHRIDPDHPTMTVVAEWGEQKIRNLHRLCPEIDIVGVNSYAGAASLAERYVQAGGAKPYILTEFGPPGTWEVARTPWDAPVEPSSTEKAGWYRRAYEGAVAGQPLCLGSYAFAWGWKQEGTATWFGMLLPDGARLGSVDTMHELWTGAPLADLCPQIRGLSLDGEPECDPGTTVRAALDAVDPEGAELTVRWVLQGEQDKPGSGGDVEDAPPVFEGAITSSDAHGAEFRMPDEPGGCRVFVYVSDGHGGAATANVPLLVRGERRQRPVARASLPLVVYDEAGRADLPFAPSGWMGNAGAIRMEEDSREAPHAGETCLRCEYAATSDWGGVVWQSPPNDWGDLAGGWDLSGAKRLTFWARGEKGTEVVTFQFGLLGADKPFPDSTRGELRDVHLTTEWQEYSIDVGGLDLRRIKTGFAWVVAGATGPAVFYLDDIRYE
jgi:hypothetical protein